MTGFTDQHQESLLTDPETVYNEAYNSVRMFETPESGDPADVYIYEDI